MKAAALALLGAALVAVLGAAAWVWYGLYDVSATTDHLPSIYRLLETTMRRSVKARAAGIAVPQLDDARLAARGAACFRDHCVQCHGGPGVPRGDAAKGLQPVPDALIDAARHWQPAELYWITRHGLKMTGMPAWEFRLGEAELWALVAFMHRLPALSPDDYAADMRDVEGERCTVPPPVCAAPPCTPPPPQATGTLLRPRGSGEEARVLLRQYACTACHVIPGTSGSTTRVGPPLDGFGRRGLVAGRLANTPDNVVAWIRSPRRIDPATAMPDMGVTEEHARQMAAYLGTLR